MSFFSEIKTIILAAESTATVRKYKNIRNESESQNYSGFPVAVLNSSFTETTTKTNGGQLRSLIRYTFLFLKANEWDNRESQNDSSQTEDPTDEIVDEMRDFANSVFWQWSNTTDLRLPVNSGLSWVVTDIQNKTSNSMSGVQAIITFAHIHSAICLN